MSVRIMWCMLRPSVSVLHTGAGPNLVQSSCFPVRWSERLCSNQKLSLKSAANIHVNVMGKVMLIFQLQDLHLRGQFCVVKNFTLPLPITTSFLDRFAKGIFVRKRHPIHIQLRPVAIIHAPFRSLTCITEQFGCWDDHWRPTVYQRKDTTVSSRKVRQKCARHRSICIRHNTRRWTHLHGWPYWTNRGKQGSQTFRWSRQNFQKGC